MDFLRAIGGFETSGETRRREERERRERDERDERRKEREHIDEREREREERRIKEKKEEEATKRREMQEEEDRKRREKQEEEATRRRERHVEEEIKRIERLQEEEKRKKEKQEEEERKRRERKEEEEKRRKEKVEKEESEEKERMLHQEQQKRQKYETQGEKRRTNDLKFLKNSKEIEIKFNNSLRSIERDLNILIVGSPGVGKSTLITNIMFAITEEYKRVTSCGKFQDGKSYTKYPSRYCLTHGLKRKSNLYLIDSPGLQNKAYIDHMADLFSGDINVKEKRKGKEISLKEQMKGQSVDRVIFVHSAREAAPEHLCKSVLEEAREHDLDIYTVLTMTDTVDEEELQAAEKDLGLKLGTHNTMRHISISHVCNADDIHDKKKAQIVCHKIRMFLNEMMAEDTESHSGDLISEFIWCVIVLSGILIAIYV